MSILSTMMTMLSDKINSQSFQNRSKTEPTAFTRKRTLTFPTMMSFIMCHSKESLPTALREHLTKLDPKSEGCTKQAFSKQRMKIKPEANLELFRDSVDHLSRQPLETLYGMRVFAIDGSRIDLPTHPELEKAFGIQRSTGNLTQALLSTAYDPLNRIVADVQIAPHDGNERKLAQQHLARIRKIVHGEPVLIIFDRGYPSAELIKALLEAGVFFLIRCSSEFFRGWLPSGRDKWVTHRFHSMKNELTFRAIRPAPSSDSECYFVTNLPNELDADTLTNIYYKRWEIEINYDFIKNRVQLENLSGITLTAVLQEMYASMLLTNLCAAYYLDNRDEEIDANPAEGRLTNRRINRNTALSVVRSIIGPAVVKLRVNIDALVENIAPSHVKNIFQYIEPNRSKERNRVHPGVKFTQSQRASV